jgi:hypothetical protein
MSSAEQLRVESAQQALISRNVASRKSQVATVVSRNQSSSESEYATSLLIHYIDAQYLWNSLFLDPVSSGSRFQFQDFKFDLPLVLTLWSMYYKYVLALFLFYLHTYIVVNPNPRFMNPHPQSFFAVTLPMCIRYIPRHLPAAQQQQQVCLLCMEYGYGH